jgi:hypothetical protein
VKLLPEGALPVSVAVTREDGSVDEVRIGYAVRSEQGLVLKLEQVLIGGRPAVVTVPSPAAPSSQTIEDLEYLAGRARRVLADPKKARWHAHERALLDEIESELNRKRSARS